MVIFPATSITVAASPPSRVVVVVVVTAANLGTRFLHGGVSWRQPTWPIGPSLIHQRRVRLCACFPLSTLAPWRFDFWRRRIPAEAAVKRALYIWGEKGAGGLHQLPRFVWLGVLTPAGFHAKAKGHAGRRLCVQARHEACKRRAREVPRSHNNLLSCNWTVAIPSVTSCTPVFEVDMRPCRMPAFLCQRGMR